MEEGFRIEVVEGFGIEVVSVGVCVTGVLLHQGALDAKSLFTEAVAFRMRSAVYVKRGVSLTPLSVGPTGCVWSLPNVCFKGDVDGTVLAVEGSCIVVATGGAVEDVSLRTSTLMIVGFNARFRGTARRGAGTAPTWKGGASGDGSSGWNGGSIVELGNGSEVETVGVPTEGSWLRISRAGDRGTVAGSVWPGTG